MIVYETLFYDINFPFIKFGQNVFDSVSSDECYGGSTGTMFRWVKLDDIVMLIAFLLIRWRVNKIN